MEGKVYELVKAVAPSLVNVHVPTEAVACTPAIAQSRSWRGARRADGRTGVPTAEDRGRGRRRRRPVRTAIDALGTGDPRAVVARLDHRRWPVGIHARPVAARRRDHGVEDGRGRNLAAAAAARHAPRAVPPVATVPQAAPRARRGVAPPVEGRFLAPAGSARLPTSSATIPGRLGKAAIPLGRLQPLPDLVPGQSRADAPGRALCVPVARPVIPVQARGRGAAPRISADDPADARKGVLHRPRAARQPKHGGGHAFSRAWANELLSRSQLGEWAIQHFYYRSDPAAVRVCCTRACRTSMRASTCWRTCSARRCPVAPASATRTCCARPRARRERRAHPPEQAGEILRPRGRCAPGSGNLRHPFAARSPAPASWWPSRASCRRSTEVRRCDAQDGLQRRTWVLPRPHRGRHRARPRRARADCALRHHAGVAAEAIACVRALRRDALLDAGWHPCARADQQGRLSERRCRLRAAVLRRPVPRAGRWPSSPARPAASDARPSHCCASAAARSSQPTSHWPRSPGDPGFVAEPRRHRRGRRSARGSRRRKPPSAGSTT